MEAVYETYEKSDKGLLLVNVISIHQKLPHFLATYFEIYQ